MTKHQNTGKSSMYHRHTVDRWKMNEQDTEDDTITRTCDDVSSDSPAPII